MCMFRMSNRFLSTPRNVVTATPRVVKRSTSVVRIPAPTPQELQMEVGVTSDETLPIMMSSGGTTTVDPEVVYVGKHKMLQVHGVDTDVVCSPNTLELDANAVVVNGEFYLNDGQHKLQLGEEVAGDVVIEGLRVECKRRKSGFKVIYDAFMQDDADVVVVRADRAERLYVVKETTFHKLLRGETDGP